MGLGSRVGNRARTAGGESSDAPDEAPAASAVGCAVAAWSWAMCPSSSRALRRLGLRLGLGAG